MIAYLLCALLLALLHQGVQGFAPVRGVLGGHARAALVTAPAPRRVLAAGPLLAAKKPDEGSQYWQGDWVCADCGYIYDRDIDGGGMYFEEQKRGFICPQCSAPRKRYAKAVGGQWGVTRDGGDFPIYAWTLVGLAATTYYALVVVPTL